MQNISDNTQAILLLTAPLMLGRGADDIRPLTPGEYKELARILRDLKVSPADLLSDQKGIHQACSAVVPADRLDALLSRGIKLAQAVDRWQSRGIWVASRSDAHYPKVLKNRLKEDSPPILYGCGDTDLLEAGGLAMVGSRDVDESTLEATREIGRQCAGRGYVVVSGGARGVDAASMRGALEADGRVIGVLADNLEKSAITREHRQPMMEGRLTLISAADPLAGFHVGLAMQRNKYIYALAKAGLVIESDYQKGGTWEGAKEQLQKYHFVPVYVQSTAALSQGRKALVQMGAKVWPRPATAEAWEGVFSGPASILPQDELVLLPFGEVREEAEKICEVPAAIPRQDAGKSQTEACKASKDTSVEKSSDADPAPSLILSACVKNLLHSMLQIRAMAPDEIANTLGVRPAQAKDWLDALEKAGHIKALKRPVRYKWSAQTLLVPEGYQEQASMKQEHKG